MLSAVAVVRQWAVGGTALSLGGLGAEAGATGALGVPSWWGDMYRSIFRAGWVAACVSTV